MMSKIFKQMSVVLTVIMLLTLSQIFVLASPVTEMPNDIYEARMKSKDQLENSGKLEKINKRIQNYYEENKDKLITSEDFKGKSASEVEELEKKITESELFDIENVPSVSSSGNNMSWSLFSDGDIVLVHRGIVVYGYYRHSGTFDSSIDACRSAQASDQGHDKGVIIEPKNWYNDNYDEAVGVSPYVDIHSPVRAGVVKFIKRQMGKPYSATALYYNWDKWSCVKLPWVAWWEKADINIAVDVSTGQPLRRESIYLAVCFPDSVFLSDNIYVFAIGE